MGHTPTTAVLRTAASLTSAYWAKRDDTLGTSQPHILSVREINGQVYTTRTYSLCFTDTWATTYPNTWLSGAGCGSRTHISGLRNQRSTAELTRQIWSAW